MNNPEEDPPLIPAFLPAGGGGGGRKRERNTERGWGREERPAPTLGARRGETSEKKTFEGQKGWGRYGQLISELKIETGFARHSCTRGLEAE